MPSLRRNVLANIAGSGWTAVLQLALVPLYLRLLGAEQFGLVGVFSTVQSLFAVVDVALGTTLNREVARLAAGAGELQDTRDLVRTLEIVYWGLGLAVAGGVLAAAPFLATHWLHLTDLGPRDATSALRLMAVVLGLLWPSGFYGGGLLGLQRQTQYNVLSAGSATVRGVGSVIALTAFAPTVHMFFVWQAIAAFAQTATFAWSFVAAMPPGRAARFRWGQVRRVGHFAAGMTGISVLSVILTQIDKLVVSRLLPLREFGYYMTAASLGLGLYRLTSPVAQAVFPRFSQLVARGELDGLSSIYHRACQVVAALVLPVGAVIAVFAPEVLQLWTHDASAVEHAHLVLSFLVAGTALNGLMTVPYALQLAFGRTRLPLLTNGIAVIVMIPLLWLSTTFFGAAGAAGGWLGLNVGYLLLCAPLAHRSTLPGETRRWYCDDVLPPLAAAAVAATIARLLAPRHAGALAFPGAMRTLAVSLVAATAAVALVLPALRGAVSGWRHRLVFEK